MALLPTDPISITYEPPLPVSARDQVNQTLRQWGLPLLPRDDTDRWLWRWRTPEGKFPKRLRKYFWQQHGIKLDPTLLAQLGQQVRAASSLPIPLLLQFTDRFDWQPGDFGDKGSCFWTTRAAARDLIAASGGHAALFYRADTGQGYARAWLVPVVDTLDLDLRYPDWAWVVFNAYGALTLSQVAHLLAQTLELRASLVSLTNEGQSDGLIYINHDVGYLLLPPHIPVPLVPDCVDLGILTSAVPRCSSCGSYLSKDQVQATSDLPELYCPDCSARLFTACPDCGSIVGSRNLLPVRPLPGLIHNVCHQCRTRNYQPCTCCLVYYDPALLSPEGYCLYCRYLLEPGPAQADP